MSKRGENIRKRKDGRWEARINTESGIKSVYANNYHAVKEKQRSYKESVVQELDRNTPFQQLCNEWLKMQEVKNKPSTISIYTGIIKKHIEPYFRNLNTYKINLIRVNDFIRFKAQQDNLQPSTIGTIITVLMQIIKYGDKQGYIQNFIYDISKPTPTKKELEIFTETEQRNLVSFIKSEITSENIGILLSLYTGMRLGEICALQWKDIDLKTGTISVSKTMQRISVEDEENRKKSIIIVDTPKSQKSIRKIPVPNFLLQELEVLSRNCFQNAYVLTASPNKFIEPRSYQYKFKRCLRQAEIRNINFHALRHTFATRAIEQNFDVKTLSEILGHSSVNFTLDRYVHPSFNLKKQNMEKIAVCY